MFVSVDLSVFWGPMAAVASVAAEGVIGSFSAYTKIRINIVRRKSKGRKKNEIRQNVSRAGQFCEILRDVLWRRCGLKCCVVVAMSVLDGVSDCNSKLFNFEYETKNGIRKQKTKDFFCFSKVKIWIFQIKTINFARDKKYKKVKMD